MGWFWMIVTFLVAAVGTLIGGLLLRWVDRKVTAMVQWRVGPPWYQPIVDVGTRETVLHEVLLRMKDDGRKVVSPGAFLPAANRFGLMVECSSWH